MIPLYVGPMPENTCEPDQATTFTEELGRHCVNLFTPALATTGGTDEGLWITGILLLIGGAALFTYNHLKKKKNW